MAYTVTATVSTGDTQMVITVGGTPEPADQYFKAPVWNSRDAFGFEASVGDAAQFMTIPANQDLPTTVQAISDWFNFQMAAWNLAGVVSGNDVVLTIGTNNTIVPKNVIGGAAPTPAIETQPMIVQVQPPPPGAVVPDPSLTIVTATPIVITTTANLGKGIITVTGGPAPTGNQLTMPVLSDGTSDFFLDTLSINYTRGSTAARIALILKNALDGFSPFAGITASATLTPPATVEVEINGGANPITSINTPLSGRVPVTPPVVIRPRAVVNRPRYQIVMADANPRSSTFKKFYWGDPKTGVPVPTARIMNTLPAAGTSPGELVFVNGKASIWTGTQWVGLAGSNIGVEASDADVFAKLSSHADGDIVTAQDTGNTYVRALGNWRVMGVRLFATEAGLKGSTMGDGSLAIADDSSNIFVRDRGNWVVFGIERFGDQATLLASTPSGVGLAYAAQQHKMFFHDGNTWGPLNVEQFDTEAHLLADLASWPIGTLAVAQDKRNVWNVTSDGAGGKRWTSVGVRHYDNATQMLGDTPAVGTNAIEIATGTQAVYRAGGWVVTNRMTYLNEAALFAASPTTQPILGFATAQRRFYMWNGNKWQTVGTQVIANNTDPMYAADLADGSMVFMVSTGNLYRRVGGAWVIIGTGRYDTEVNLLNDTPAIGADFIAIDTGNEFIGVSDGAGGTKWLRKNLIQYPNAAARIADTLVQDGNVAVDVDTGQFWTRVGGAWRGISPVLYATEADRTVATPPNGTFGMTQDTRKLYIRLGGAWTSPSGNVTTVANTAPTTASTGDIWIDNTNANKFVWHVHNGTSFVELKAGGSIPVAATAPTGGAAGDLYYNNSPANAGVYINDGSAWWRVGVKYTAATGGAPADATGIDGDIGNNVTTGRTYIRANGNYRPVSGPYTVDFSWNDKEQHNISLPLWAYRYVRIRAHMTIADGASRIGIIAQYNGNWMDWGQVKDTRFTAHNYGDSNVWFNWNESNIHNSQAGMQLTAGDGVKTGTRAYVHVDIDVITPEPTMRWTVNAVANGSNKWVSWEGWTTFSDTLGATYINAIGLKMFSGDKNGVLGAKCAVRGLVEYL